MFYIGHNASTQMTEVNPQITRSIAATTGLKPMSLLQLEDKLVTSGGAVLTITTTFRQDTGVPNDEELRNAMLTIRAIPNKDEVFKRRFIEAMLEDE